MSQPNPQLRDEPESPESRYGVHSRLEILALLHAIMTRRCLVNLDLPKSRHIVVTSILELDVPNRRVFLDVARGDALNRELLSGDGAEFIAQLDGIHISFHTSPVRLATHDGLPALEIDVPDCLIRLQRREHFRVAVPRALGAHCLIPAPDEQREPANLQLIDIGCGGIALADVSGRVGPETGRIFENCSLILPELKVTPVRLEVRNSTQIRLANGAFQTRIGCRFDSLPADALPRLQRFVMKLERERRHTH